ncbi:MAG: polysaccharide biosynthesis protein, partial [Planctomycetota bacterium]
LAKSLKKLSGFRPDEDIPIRFVGLRPGEKLFEELLVEAEGVSRTEHEKIWILDGQLPDSERVQAEISDLLAAAELSDPPAVVRGLAGLVQDYAPSERYRGIAEEAREQSAG